VRIQKVQVTKGGKRQSRKTAADENRSTQSKVFPSKAQNLRKIKKRIHKTGGFIQKRAAKRVKVPSLCANAATIANNDAPRVQQRLFKTKRAEIKNPSTIGRRAVSRRDSQLEKRGLDQEQVQGPEVGGGKERMKKQSVLATRSGAAQKQKKMPLC